MGPSQTGMIQQPQMSPDGKRLFYTVRQPTANEVWALENFIPTKKEK